MVVARYGVEGQVGGLLGVVGPTRMQYGRAIAIVRYMTELLNDLLAEQYGSEQYESDGGMPSARTHANSPIRRTYLICPRCRRCPRWSRRRTHPDAAEGDPVGATGDAAHADGPNFTLVDGESSRATPAAAAAPTDSRDADAAAGAAASATAKDGAPGTESAAGTAAGPGPSDAADTPAPDSLAALRDRVDQLERDLAHERDQATEYLNRWQRAQADMSNLRRRADQERDQLHAFAAWQAVAFALPAIDSLERAFQTLPEPLTGLTWINGVALVDHQLRQAVAALGVTEIAADPASRLTTRATSPSRSTRPRHIPRARSPGRSTRLRNQWPHPAANARRRGPPTTLRPGAQRR